MTTADGDVAVLDTNILVYAADEASEFHVPAKEIRDRGVQGDVLEAISPQSLFAFFAVITNPRRVMQPRSPQEAREEMEKYLQAPTMRQIYPGEDIVNRVLTLLQQHPQITRQDIFDCTLVATMQTNGIKHIYTYNRQHFTLFSDIEVLTP
jgi:predicted nucleic acid-binding protein